ncbi:TPA: succinate-semialdehyde dehydrogenase (NADP(+)), partial [Candidatus Collierbacteria bacterium]|nr:succinate-semialdehyde dehydrogenase (NADP(+)) [Candidatus Collierbacteria bacterium]
VDFGPLVFPEQVTKLEEVIADAVSRRAKIVIGGKRLTGKEYAKGNYFEPTILTNITPDMRVMSEEVFGPVLPVVSFETEDQVVEMANNTEYGLTSEVYTTDLKKGERIAKRLDSGVVAINTDNYFKPSCPFGGCKKSGMGREYGEIGIQEFAQVKLIAVNQP